MDWFEYYAVTQVITSDTTGGAPERGDRLLLQRRRGLALRRQPGREGRSTAPTASSAGTRPSPPRPARRRTTRRPRRSPPTTGACRTTTPLPPPVTLTDSQGGTHADSDALAGQPLETTVYNGDTAARSTIPRSPPTGSPAPPSATEARSAGAAGPDRQHGPAGRDVHPAGDHRRRQYVDWPYTETDTTYDAATGDADFGLATYSYTHTVPVNSAYDSVHPRPVRARRTQARTWSAWSPRPRPTGGLLRLHRGSLAERPVRAEHARRAGAGVPAGPGGVGDGDLLRRRRPSPPRSRRPPRRRPATSR